MNVFGDKLLEFSEGFFTVVKKVPGIEDTLFASRKTTNCMMNAFVDKRDKLLGISVVFFARGQ